MSLRKYLRRWRQDRDRAAEIQTHLDLAEQYYIDRGMMPADARRHARIRFGNPRGHREGVHDMNRLPVLDALGSDLRYAVRRLRQSPAFTATVVLTLAVTIGAASAVFSLADIVLFRPLPLPDPDRLAIVGFRRATPTGVYIAPSVDGAMWAAVRDRTTLIDVALGSDSATGVNFVSNSTPSVVQNQRVGAGYFRVLGVSPFMGREFTADEARSNGASVAILSHALWQRIFAGDTSVLGRTIRLRGEPFSIVGVMPENFSGLAEADVWTPYGEPGQGLNYTIVARLRDDVSLEAANAELAALGETPFTMLLPLKEGTSRSLELQDMHETLVADAREPIVMLGWAAGAVLLIACVNITALLMARGGTRVKEIATRMALGGSRLAVVRQLMVESVVLAIVGAAAGLLFAQAGLEGLRALGGTTFSGWDRAALDYRTVLAGFTLAGVTSVLFGLLPAWQASRIDVQRGLGESGSRTIAGGSRHLARRLLVVTEVAVGVVVLVAAGLLLRQFLFFRGLDPGFTTTNLYSVSASLQDARYRDAGAVRRLFASSLEELNRTPGIGAAAVSQRTPYERMLNMTFNVDGLPDEGRPPIANIGYVTPGFFDTFGIPVLHGRALEEKDRTESVPVAVVNQAFAQHYFKGDASAVGRRLVFGKTTIEIVGVSRNVQQAAAGFFLTGMQRGPVATSPTIYLPAAQVEAGVFNWFSPVWTIRAASAAQAAAALSSAIGRADPLLPLGSVRSMEQVSAAAMAQPRLMTMLVGALALAALVLAAIGVHGLIVHIVAERTREFGIRIALGATPRATVAQVARSGVVLAGIGTVVGIALSIPAARLIESSLYTVRAGDVTTYVGVGALLFGVACLSSVVPALRILRLDPAQALR
jgi:predicted permease